jgi:hypothetical protein
MMLKNRDNIEIVKDNKCHVNRLRSRDERCSPRYIHYSAIVNLGQAII